MKQVIHDFYSGEETSTLDFQWDQTWKPTEGKDPFAALFRFCKGEPCGWSELTEAITDLMTVNGQKITSATLDAQLRGEWLYLAQIVEGIVANAVKQFQLNER